VVCGVAGIVIAEFTFHPIRRQLKPEVAQHPERYFASATSEEVAITAPDGAVLRGWYAEPRSPNGNAVLLLHGLSDNRLGMAGFSGFLLRSGYAVLLPDSRAHGESGGRIATFGLLERGDVQEWVSWVQKRAHPRCIYGLGESMGAAIMLQSLAVEPRFCAVVVESPFATFQEAAQERIGRYAGMGPHWFGQTVGRPIIWSAELYGRLRYGVNLISANPLEAVDASSTPVLLIHGDHDTNLLPRNSESMWRAAPDHTELWLVPGAEHTGAYGIRPEEFERRVLGWFEQHR